MANPQTEPAAPPVEKRFFSDGLMLEMGHALVEKGLVSRAQIDDLNSRRALTNENLDALLIKDLERIIVKHAAFHIFTEELAGIIT